MTSLLILGLLQLSARGTVTDYEYDSANRLVQTWYPLVAGETLRHGRHTEYDGLGRKILETDEAGVSTGYTYDVRGLLTSVTQDYGQSGAAVTTYTYDTAGNLATQTDANGHTTAFQYDALGRRTKRTLPDSAVETTAYSYIPEATGSATNVTSTAVTDFRGKTITTVNDRMDRLWTRSLPAVNSGESGTTEAYAYTTAGQLAQVTESGDVTRTQYLAYDALNRLAKKDVPEGVLAYGYTADNHLASLQAYRRSAVTANGTITSGTAADVDLAYGYDTLGRLTTVTDNILSTTAATTYAYDPVGNLDHFVYPNGLAHAYRYTEQNRLRLLELTIASGTLIQSYTYALNRSGMRTGVTESNLVSGTAVVRRSASYEYDQNYASGAAPARVYRLTRENLFNSSGSAAGVITHVYDLVGNRTSRTTTGLTPVDAMPDQTGLTFNARDLIAGTYDANGNSTAYETGTTTGDVYDAENRLIARSTTITVGYDADGNRVKKTVSGATTYYLVDDLNPTGYAQVVAEWSNTGNPPDRAYTPGSELIAQRRNTGSTSSPTWTVSYYGYDGQGSIRLLTDTSTTPTVTDTYDYDAYGQLLAASGSTPNAYRYTGQQWDTDLGMYYLRARYYQPNQGRFWTMDTVEGKSEDPRSLHKYLYCNDNPLNGFDPSGHDDLMSLSLASSISSSLSSMYNGTDLVIQHSLQNTILGVMAGMSQGDILANYYSEVGKGVVAGFLIGKAMSLLDDVLSTGTINLLSSPAGGTLAGEEVSIAVQENRYLNLSGRQSSSFVGPQTRGRLGSVGTRQQVEEIVAKLKKSGWNVENHGGFGGAGEEYIPPQNGANGGSYADITATKSGKYLRVNTVDTGKGGLPTQREAINAARIQLQKPNDTLILIPKWK